MCLAERGADGHCSPKGKEAPRSTDKFISTQRRPPDDGRAGHKDVESFVHEAENFYPVYGERGTITHGSLRPIEPFPFRVTSSRPTARGNSVQRKRFESGRTAPVRPGLPPRLPLDSGIPDRRAHFTLRTRPGRKLQGSQCLTHIRTESPSFSCGYPRTCFLFREQSIAGRNPGLGKGIGKDNPGSGRLIPSPLHTEEPLAPENPR